MNDFFEIGKVVNTQGLKGEIKIFPTTDDPQRFELLDEIIINIRGNDFVYKMDKVRYNKQFVILKLLGIDDINQAESLKGGTIKIPVEKALPLSKDEYYIRDLLDIDVFTDENEYLGKIIKIFPTGANDVYIIDNNKTELLIPAIKDCILDVNLSERKMKIKLLDGLRD